MPGRPKYGSKIRRIVNMSVINRLKHDHDSMSGGIEFTKELPSLQFVLQRPLLNRAEEMRLAIAAASGSHQAKEELVLRNLRIVVRISGEFYPRRLDRVDLFQEGVIGLMHGIDHFDPHRGYRLVTYVTWWIRQTMHRAIVQHGYGIRLPFHRHYQYARLCRYIDDFTAKQGRAPTDAEIADALSMSERDVRHDRLYQHGNENVSLQRTIKPSPNDEDRTITRAIRDETVAGISPEIIGAAVLVHRDLQRQYQQRFERLLRYVGRQHRNTEMFVYRFGLDGSMVRNKTDVAKRFRVTKERVRQIIDRLLKTFFRTEPISLDEAEQLIIDDVERFLTLAEFIDPDDARLRALVRFP